MNRYSEHIKIERSEARAAIRLLALLSVVLIALIVSSSLAENEFIQGIIGTFGYIGVFGISIISGFNFAVPIPAVAFTELFLASGLSFLPLILLISLGMTIGDSLGFFIGKTGRNLSMKASSNKFIPILENAQEKYPIAPFVLLFFYVSFAPAPNELLVIPMAFLGYSFRYMFPVVFLGNLLFNFLAALSIVHLL